MKIVVVGAGEIGFHLAKRLSTEHDITLIDRDLSQITRATEQLDAHVLHGHGTSLSTLREAGLPRADAVAAVTDNDELNLLICQIAKNMGVADTVARVRNHEYTSPNFVIPPEQLGADLIIHPEKETADAVISLLRQSIATDIIKFADGQMELIGIRLDTDSPILRIPLKELSEEVRQLPMRFVAIHRKNRTLIPRGDDILARGDQLFITCAPKILPEIMRITGKTDVKLNDVMILGGGLVGQFVARGLKSINVKIVESNSEKSEMIADQLPNCLVIHGDGTDVDLLAAEGLIDMDAFIAVTGVDETNIIATLVARHLRVPRTIALVNKMEYMPITPTIGMDAVVSKQLITVNAIMRYIYHRQVASISMLPSIDAQIIEFVAAPGSKICKRPLKDIHFPRQSIVGAVISKGIASVPVGSTRIQAGDKVMVFTMPSVLKKVEKLFS